MRKQANFMVFIKKILHFGDYTGIVFTEESQTVQQSLNKDGYNRQRSRIFSQFRFNLSGLRNEFLF